MKDQRLGEWRARQREARRREAESQQLAESQLRGRRITASLPGPDNCPDSAVELCGNCGRQPVQFRGRCKTCYSYRIRFREERPERLWNGKRKGPVWKPAGVTDRCDCGKAARWRVTVPISEKSRTTLLLCEACAALEKS